MTLDFLFINLIVLSDFIVKIDLVETKTSNLHYDKRKEFLETQNDNKDISSCFLGNVDAKNCDIVHNKQVEEYPLNKHNNEKQVVFRAEKVQVEVELHQVRYQVDLFQEKHDLTQLLTELYSSDFCSYF